MKRGAAPDLAWIDASIERARELTRRKLTSRFFRRLVQGKERFNPRPKMSRAGAFDKMRAKRAALVVRRNRQADTPLAIPWSPTAQPQLDALYDLAESRGAKELRHCQVRQAVAAKLERVAAWARGAGLAEPEQFTAAADLLRRARRVAWWGEHRDTGALVVRFMDRSGLALLDPSEARERQAVLIERLVPTIEHCIAAGLRVYYAVFSEPNVEAGSLAFGKRHLFERFRRAILGGAVPEVVGAFAVQEDPLAADLQTWNVHLNVILVVDPTRCTALPPDLALQLELGLPGQIAKLSARLERDRAPPGALSYAKLHYLWGAHQVEVRPLRSSSSAGIARTIREVVKYSAKWISSKQLDELAVSPPTAGSTELVDAAPPGYELDGARRRGRGRPPAPGVVDWPEARVAEWIRANQRFRRVRGWGVLYRIAKRERAPDPDKAGKIRWLGRVFVEPRGVLVQAHFPRYLDSIHGDKSARDFRGPGAFSALEAGGGARAGPSGAGFMS